MIIWLYLFYVQFYFLLKILKIISLQFLFSIIILLVFYKNFSTMSSPHY